MASPHSQQNLSLQQVENESKDKKQRLLANAAPLIRDDIDKQEAGHDMSSTENPNKYKRRTCGWFCCGFVLLLFVIQLTFVPYLISQDVRNNITDAFVFTHPEPDNDHYQQWITNSKPGDTPISFSIQFFNITNPDEVLQGAIPKLNIVGPLVYDQYYTRQNVTFSANGEYVNHTFFTEYLFNEELSKISPDEKLTVLSPLVSTLYHRWNVSKIIERDEMELLMAIFEDDPKLLFWSDRTASDLIWNIYHFDPLDFHWGFMRNQSNQYYVLHTGKNDPSRMGEVQRWCRSPLNMSCLLDDSTQYISQWNPPMPINPAHLFYEGVYTLTDLDDKDDVPPLWIDILFRNVYLEYNHTHNYKGVDLYSYGISLEPQFLNASLYPPNEQFNQFGPSGIFNSSAAYDDISIYLSMVLFFGAPDYMANNSNLSLPDPGPYDYPYIDIEPRTGAVFYANASMQICTPIHSLPNIRNSSINESEPNLFNIVDDMMIPIYLVTFADAVPDDTVDNFKKNLSLGHTLHKMSIIIGWIAVPLLFLWCAITVFAAGVYWHGYKVRNIN